MRLIYTLLIFSVFTPFLLHSQVDQVSVGAAYSKQAYYNISTGEVTQVDNNAWDIAFSNAGAIDAGVFINESANYGEAPLYVWLAQDVVWEDDITDTSVFTDDNTINNPEESWTEGVFNSVKDPQDPFDYGWGAYNSTTHIIEATKVFVIQLREGTYIKFQIESLSGGGYTFKYADLDGQNESSYTVEKDENAGQLIYFSFYTNELVEMPTEYDLVFQRYSSLIPDGTGNFVPYTVTGVLLGPGIEGAAAIGVDPTEVDYNDYIDELTSNPTVIGYNWKSFDFSVGWIVADDQAYFVKLKNGDIYKIVFYDFEGSSTGITTLEKTYVGTIVGTKNTIKKSTLAINIYPNPTSDYVTIDGLDNATSCKIVNLNGQLVANQKIKASSVTIATQNWVSGQYSVIVSDGQSTTVRPLIINK